MDAHHVRNAGRCCQHRRCRWPLLPAVTSLPLPTSITMKAILCKRNFGSGTPLFEPCPLASSAPIVSSDCLHMTFPTELCIFGPLLLH
ncbi:hypothetical protein FKM82_012005 [Ascaphus truei]